MTSIAWRWTEHNDTDAPAKTPGKVRKCVYNTSLSMILSMGLPALPAHMIQYALQVLFSRCAAIVVLKDSTWSGKIDELVHCPKRLSLMINSLVTKQYYYIAYLL